MGRKKPYSSVKSRRNFNYSGGQNKGNKYVARKESFFKEKKSLENTTRIRIDKDRLNDFESLDTSFLEGRRKKKITREVKSEKRSKPRKRYNVSIIKKFRNVFYFLGVLSLVILIIVFFSNSFLFTGRKSDNMKKDIVKEQEKQQKKESEIDTNYLFIGGYHTDKFSLDELGFLYPYVKKSKEEFFTDDILDSMKENIYDYNPSLIFFELGTSDYVDGKSEDEILKNIEDIIIKTKDNRPYAEIYVESFYPINKDVEDFDDELFKDKDNKDLMDFNKKIERLCKSVHVHYLDIYSELIENDKLNDKYTADGIHLNEDGYKRLFKVIRKIVDSK